MAFRSTAAEPFRQYNQNKNDIEELYSQGKEAIARIDVLATEVTGLRTRFGHLATQVDGLDTKVDNLTTRVDRLDTKVDNLTTRMDPLDTKVDRLNARFDHVDSRFDRLEQFLDAPGSRHDPSLPSSDPRTFDLPNATMNRYSRHTMDTMTELDNQQNLLAAHVARFDTLDSRMSEILGILRAPSA